MVGALTVDGAERESDFGGSINSLSVVPRKQGRLSNPAADVLLHPAGHVDQPPPRPLDERHHPIHVLVARQRNFDLALTFGDFRLGLFQRSDFGSGSSILPLTAGSRAASSAFSFSLSACSRPISASSAARSSGTV